ncbi:MAG TPA: DUF4097 family beta strand repeat-containing protein [Gemmatimonadales bacterium]
MLALLATVTALTLSAPADTTLPVASTDTTVPVTRGARLDVNNFGGDITIKTWDKSAVRITADNSERERVDVDAGSGVVTVRTSSRYGAPRLVSFEITVPVWMALTLEGTYTDITVTGSAGDISATTVQGDIEVTGGSGHLSLNSTSGTVKVSKAHGRIEAVTVNDGITIIDCAGDITAETTNGDIELRGIDAANVEATTVNGDVTYDGAIKDGGHYSYSTNNGDVSVSLPEGANATVNASTFNGDFDACFPVQMTSPHKHRYTFTVGTGSARIEMESFGGDLTLCRPGQAKPSRHDRDEDNDNDNR